MSVCSPPDDASDEQTRLTPPTPQAYVSLGVTDGLFRDAARLGWRVEGRFETEVRARHAPRVCSRVS
jgi:hypothetical protein